ncbi:MAG: acyl-ACP--UDP-N-acetylglucosamine O-acyltransferase [Candidatus Kapaibacterium sp.]
MNKKIEIHPTAIVSEKAKIADGVTIGAFTIIEDDVEIGANCEIRSGVVLANGTRLGEGCRIHASAVIGTEPQDLKYDGEMTYAIIGDRTVVREFATINRATASTGKTVVGSDCLIMSYSHVAHDCRLGNNVIMSNATQLAGHVTIGEYVIFGGVAKVHQFCKVGHHVMVAADAMVTKDVAPYVLLGRKPQVEGVNKIGLRRRGFSNQLIGEIENFYDTVIFSGLNTRDGIEKYKQRKDLLPEIEGCIEFIENSTRGIYR